jgi:hypothetical protein
VLCIAVLRGEETDIQLYLYTAIYNVHIMAGGNGAEEVG